MNFLSNSPFPTSFCLQPSYIIHHFRAVARAQSLVSSFMYINISHNIPATPLFIKLAQTFIQSVLISGINAVNNFEWNLRIPSVKPNVLHMLQSVTFNVGCEMLTCSPNYLSEKLLFPKRLHASIFGSEKTNSDSATLNSACHRLPSCHQYFHIYRSLVLNHYVFVKSITTTQSLQKKADRSRRGSTELTFRIFSRSS